MRLVLIVFAMSLVTAVAVGEEKKPAESSSTELKVGTRVGQRLPQFKVEAWDFGGEKPKKWAHDSHKLERPTAYVFMSRTCPFCTMYEERLAEMSRTYGEKGLDLVMVYPTRKTAQEKKVEYHKKSGFKAAFVNDKDASIVKALRVTKTPEIVLVKKSGEIAFRGGIDDNPRSAERVKKPFLKNACDEVLAGKKVKVTSAPLYG